MPRSQAPTDDGGPRRRCIASGLVSDKTTLIRFVVGPEQEIVPDVDERLPGRGFWLSADRDVLMKACLKNRFARAARAPVGVPTDLCERVEALLVRRCLHLIGLARRARQIAFGFEKVRSWLRDGRDGVVFVAADGGPAARARTRALARGRPVVELLRGDELGLADGRDRIVHLMVASGSLADRLYRETTRLAGFRKPPPTPLAAQQTKGLQSVEHD